MSAYGVLPPHGKSGPTLGTTLWKLRTKRVQEDQGRESLDWTHVTLHHLTLKSAPQELVTALFEEFSSELERDQSRTYPQEAGMTRDEFESYFFARDVFVGIGVKMEVKGGEENIEMTMEPLEDKEGSMESFLGGRKWNEALAGFYYVSTIRLPYLTLTLLQVKPNYPGHSSHVSNSHCTPAIVLTYPLDL
jgi:hypothetical protein